MNYKTVPPFLKTTFAPTSDTNPVAKTVPPRASRSRSRSRNSERIKSADFVESSVETEEMEVTPLDPLPVEQAARRMKRKADDPPPAPADVESDQKIISKIPRTRSASATRVDDTLLTALTTMAVPCNTCAKKKIPCLRKNKPSAACAECAKAKIHCSLVVRKRNNRRTSTPRLASIPPSVSSPTAAAAEPFALPSKKGKGKEKASDTQDTEFVPGPSEPEKVPASKETERLGLSPAAPLVPGVVIPTAPNPGLALLRQTMVRVEQAEQQLHLLNQFSNKLHNENASLKTLVGQLLQRLFEVSSTVERLGGLVTQQATRGNPGLSVHTAVISPDSIIDGDLRYWNSYRPGETTSGED